VFGAGDSRELIDRLSDDVFVHDLEGNFLDINDTAVERLGYSRDELLSMKPQDIDSPEFAEKFEDRVQIIEEEETLVFETIHVTEDGEEIPVEINASLITYDGEPAILSIAREVKKRNEGEANREEYQELLTSTLDAVDSCLMVIDENHRIILSNWKDHEWVSEEKREEMPYCYEVMKGFDSVCEPCRPIRTFGDGKIRRFEDQNPVDGGYKEITVFPIFDENDDVKHVLENVRDVTERKKAEEKLKKSESELSAIFENIPIIIMLVDRERRVRKINDTGVEFAGKTEEEMIGQRGGKALRCLHHLDDPKGCGFGSHCENCTVRNTVLDTFETGESHYRKEGIITFKQEGEEREMIFWVSTALIGFGEKEHVLVSIEDITEQRKSEERKEFLNTLLRQDLRSECQSVQAYQQLLGDTDLSEKQEEYLKKSVRAGQKADEILKVAKELREIEESDWITGNNVFKIMENAIDDISDLVDREKVKIQKNFPEKIGKVEGDYSLNTLFSSLLRTRIQTSGCSKMKISALEGDREITVKIQDDGKRLPRDVKNLFTGDLYTGKTTGVGGARYYMLREIARHNNAEIKVQDSEIGGAKFDIHLKKS